MVLVGRVNKSLVSLIQQAGGSAVGLCGKDANLVSARVRNFEELGFVGDVTGVNIEIINSLTHRLAMVTQPIMVPEPSKASLSRPSVVRSVGSLALSLEARSLSVSERSKRVFVGVSADGGGRDSRGGQRGARQARPCP
eukprot:8260830-Pyramimonas_sp.AAC.1